MRDIIEANHSDDAQRLICICKLPKTEFIVKFS